MIFYFLFIFLWAVNCLPESGHYESLMNMEPYTFPDILKTMYKNTHINLKVSCTSSQDILLKVLVKYNKYKCLNTTISSKEFYLENSLESNHNISCHRNQFDNNLIFNGIISKNSGLFVTNDSNHYLTTTEDAIYHLRFQFEMKPKLSNLSVKVELKSWYGYLSARDWPLLIFYAVMCGVYSLFALIWLVLSCRNWRDLLRIQFWIGAVIFLGMLEKAIFVSEYQSINKTGIPLKYPILIAEIVSCIKRMLARILLMIVCIGYGIVKQRLGPAMKKILGVGIAYLIAALFEGYIRVLKPELYHSKYTFIPDIILVCLDAVILWWSFSYLIETIKQMRMKHNVVKFNLYRHFSNILIIVIIASAIFMAWALYTFKSTNCNQHWKELWINEAYWHILFSIVLLTIVVLWRPSKNSQRYAYSPLLDADDDLDDDNDNEIIMDNLTSGELRKPSKETQSKKAEKKTAEDDLKWIEENIPASAAEKLYPLVDSDSEITPSKITAGKMD